MLSYVVEGDGAPLVMIHGFGVGVTIWERLTPLLRRSFRLIQIELPGIGGSSSLTPERDYFDQCAIEIEKLRVSLGLEQLDIVSYSMGTRAAEHYQHLHPERVGGIIYLCPAVLRIVAIQLLRLGDWIDGWWPALLNWILGGWLMSPFLLGFGFSFMPNRDLVVWQREISAQRPDALKAMLRGVLYSASRPFGHPNARHLFVWARTDITTKRPRPLGECDRVLATSHDMPLSRPAEVADIIKSFFDVPDTASA